jgi:hypothetical protein
VQRGRRIGQRGERVVSGARGRRRAAAAALALAAAVGWAQTQPEQAKPGQTPAPAAQNKPETHITPEQARELFASVDQILQFASQDTKLPIEHPVKRKLTTRAAVESYVLAKMHDDKDTRRMQRSEIVLKKFGLLDKDFQLRPFLVSLLTEQIAGYYDSKTKTVNLLDWIAPDQQKPVMAHELTHALQDQRVDLEKWGDKSSDALSRNVKQDNEHLATDEEDTARDAVAEGQAMVVFIDYGLRPSGKTLLTMPDILGNMREALDDPKDSPVMARAPLLLKESLLFPYESGLAFEAAVEKNEGAKKAFAGVLDRPPASSYEVMNPQAWEAHRAAPLLKMPDVHPLLDGEYEPYDIGVMGELDVRILAELFGGDDAAGELTPKWDGGLYYAVQKKGQPANSTGSVALLYYSQWTDEDAAAAFAQMYARNLGRKYTHVERDAKEELAVGERVYGTNEGPVLISTEGKQVFISESFDLTLARKLGFLIAGAQEGGESQVARGSVTPETELSGGLAARLCGYGVMRAGLGR